MKDKSNTNIENQETLLQFPCEFPIKVMGKNHATFASDMCELIQTFVDQELDTSNISSRPSRSGKYSALTITITAKSKNQLDKIYQALYAHEDVHMTL
ncbi:MAG: DUF493 domain-containing protein [Gammaproteobacteria bacterium]|nr:DUF493 domain-containing protein [Gammaproteobacteria bacterium]NNC96893.1 DUF493 domain-containing protein [Gammaproteobacteria bacterium]NNM13308.1 DUF493 domain-containing protein [Gammaproteobacteria bacterium]